MYISILWLLTSLHLTFSGLATPSCDEVEERVAEADKNTVILFPPEYLGNWVSDRCETRSGPEYLLRYQRYSDNDSFSSVIHVYSDSHCSHPWYSTLCRGKAVLRGRSWLAPAAAQADFTIEAVILLPHSQKAADEMTNILNNSCPGMLKRRLWPHINFTVFTSQEIADLTNPQESEWTVARLVCLKPLRLSHSEASLLRVQVRPPAPPESVIKRTELLLGEVRAKGTLFHAPLLFASQTEACLVCSSLERSSLNNPPKLDPPATGPMYIAGEWVSTRCEVRPMGLFLRRRLRVSERTWQADYKFFSDPICTVATLTASAEGTLAEVTRKRLPGATDYDFKVLRAFLTVHDDSLLTSLTKDTTCGPPGEWQIGVRRDMTPSGGCPSLGIVVPSVEYELVRLDQDNTGQSLLYLGQSEQKKGVMKQRPTAFQPPLFQCNVLELPPLIHFLNSFNAASAPGSVVPVFSILVGLRYFYL